jgi:hypothetical protein
MPDLAAASAEAMAALTEALRNGSSRLLLQNITLVFPGDSPSLHALLGSLLAGRPALLTQSMEQEQRQQQQLSGHRDYF